MSMIYRALAVAALSVSLAGCAAFQGANGSSSTRDDAAVEAGAAQLQPQYDVRDVTINVSRDLIVSEENRYYPQADIVWRGDPVGDRYEQIEAILTSAAKTATDEMTKGRAVNVELSLTRFHALTELTRLTIGGVHSIKFMLTVRDAASGDVIDGPRLVEASTPAAGGSRALAEDRAGRTQKVVVTERVVEVLRAELSVPVAEPALAEVSRAGKPVNSAILPEG